MKVNYKQLLTQDWVIVSAIACLTLGRVLANHSVGCPTDFDCNSYIRMTHDLTYSADVPGHHGMRVFPILMVRLIMWFGLSVEHGFQVLSGASYVSFGTLSYLFLRNFTQSKLWAISWTLLLLSLHLVMRAPLNLVYQSIDAMVYSIGLAVLWATWRQKTTLTFSLSVIGALTRQNLFVLGFFSLLYLFKKQKSALSAMYLVLLTLMYMGLQNYYQAHGVFSALLSPPENFFSLSYQWTMLIESQMLELWLVLIPFMVLGAKPLFQFFKEHWHWFIYAAITIGQPYLGFHLTGNNLPRLALQGVWVFALAIALTYPYERWSPTTQWLFILFALGIYFTWDLDKRIWIVGCWTLILVWQAYSISKTNDCSMPLKQKQVNG